MPAIEILLATIQEERRRRIDHARLVRAVVASRPTLLTRLVGPLRSRLGPRRVAATPAQPATGAGPVVS